MLTNSLYNIPASTSFETKNTYFSLEKQSSETVYLQQEENTKNNNVVNYKKPDESINYNNTRSFNGYYDMFVASQELQKSEVLNNYNYQMYMKKYA